MDIKISDIEVMGTQVLIKRSENDTHMGELSLSTNSSTPRSSGTVLQIGNKNTLPIKVGDLVILDSTKITVISIDDEEYICVDSSSIIGVVHKEKIQPLGRRILVMREESDDTLGELMLSDSSLVKKSTGRVLALGEYLGTEILPGDLLIFDKYGEVVLSYEDTEYVVISPETVIAKINL